MSWTDWTLLGLFILGFLLFLYGANVYNATVGYSGVFLFVGSIARPRQPIQHDGLSAPKHLPGSPAPPQPGKNLESSAAVAPRRRGP